MSMLYGYQSSIIHAFMDILGFIWISMHWLAMDSRSRASAAALSETKKKSFAASEK